MQIHTHACTYACTHARTYIRTHIHTYACRYTVGEISPDFICLCMCRANTGLGIYPSKKHSLCRTSVYNKALVSQCYCCCASKEDSPVVLLPSTSCSILESGASKNPCAEDFAGSAAFSQKSVREVAEYLKSIPDLKVYINFHSYSQLWMYPWAYAKEETPDNADLVSFSPPSEEYCDSFSFVFSGDEYKLQVFPASISSHSHF